MFGKRTDSDQRVVKPSAPVPAPTAAPATPAAAPVVASPPLSPAKPPPAPVVENRRLARSLYDKCEVGDFVPRELFGPVAEILAYVYKTLKKVRK